MKAKAALAQALLDGRVINIKNCFETIGLTNAPREISRMIEKDFGVSVTRTHRAGKSRYGSPVTWVDYRLNCTEENREGIVKMREYIAKQKSESNPTTERQLKQLSFL